MKNFRIIMTAKDNAGHIGVLEKVSTLDEISFDINSIVMLIQKDEKRELISIIVVEVPET